MQNFTNDARERFVNCARSFLGLREADGSHRPIIDIYNTISPLPRGYKMSYSDPWCAAFVSAVGKQTGLNCILPECSCERMIDAYRALGRVDKERRGEPGDIVFYDFDGGSSDHVGILAENENGLFTVIEGNYGDAVGARCISASSPVICCFARPDFVGDMPQPLSALPTLRLGAIGLPVRAMQTLLISRGFGCGPCEADGEFGADTFRALNAFKMGCGMDSDGIADEAVWFRLIGG